MGVLHALVMVVPMALGLVVGLVVLSWSRRARLANRRSPLTSGLLRAPGHALRNQFDDAFVDLMAWLMAAMFMPALLGALYGGALQRAGGTTWVTAAIYLVPATLIVALSAYKMVKLHSKAMDVRMGLDAEVVAGQELDQLMRKGGVVFHDFPAANFNIDHVLICGAGVFAVETKSRLKPDRGQKDDAKVVFDGKTLAFPTWTEIEPLDQARRQAVWLGKQLSGAVGETVVVKPVLALPGWYVEQSGRSDVRVLNPKNFHFLLEAKGEPLSQEVMQRIAYQVDRRCRDIDPAYTAN